MTEIERPAASTSHSQLNDPGSTESDPSDGEAASVDDIAVPGDARERLKSIIAAHDHPKLRQNDDDRTGSVLLCGWVCVEDTY